MNDLVERSKALGLESSNLGEWVLRIEALETALRWAREALNLIGWSRHPADLLTVKHAAKYEAKAVQAITKINEVIGNE